MESSDTWPPYFELGFEFVEATSLLTFLPGTAVKLVRIRFRFLWTLLPPVEETENKICVTMLIIQNSISSANT